MKAFPILATVAALMLAAAIPTSRAAVPLAADGDADGVPDDQDACLYSPRGIVVGPNGCSTPGDEDEDQVADSVDACPQSPAGAIVDAQGCALDQDLDGVADGVDRCPGSPSGAPVDARGCAQGQLAAPPPMRRAYVPPAPMQPAPPPAPVAPMRPAAPAPAVATLPPPPPPAAPVAAPAPVVAAKPTPPIATQPAAATGHPEPDRTFYFDPGESALGWSNARAVKQSARELMLELESNPSLALVVSGHGDIKFDGMSVPRVVSARATEVRNALIAAGVPPQRVTMRVPGINEPRFYGESQPRNCRAEVRVTGRAAVAPPASGAAATASPAPAPSAAPVARVFPDPPSRVRPEPPPRPATLPLPGKPAPPVAAPGTPAMRTLVGTSVKFEPFSSVLDDAAIQALNGFAQPATRLMLADTTSRIVIYSGIGTGEAGATAQRLSESRAGSVASYLVSLGLPHNRMDVSNQTQTGERRVDIRVLSP